MLKVGFGQRGSPDRDYVPVAVPVSDGGSGTVLRFLRGYWKRMLPFRSIKTMATSKSPHGPFRGHCRVDKPCSNGFWKCLADFASACLLSANQCERWPEEAPHAATRLPTERDYLLVK